MVEEDGKYVGTTISMFQSKDGDSNDFDILSTTNVQKDDTYGKIDSSMTMNSLFNNYKQKQHSQKYEALCILSLFNHESFVGWYNETNNTKYTNTESIYNSIKNADLFRETVRRYFNATNTSWNSFIDQIKTLI